MDQSCPIKMRDGRRCGRPLHKTVHREDKVNSCLMHTHDPKKDVAAFQEEFERILKAARTALADFSGFVFPTANYSRKFTAGCDFSGATFTQDAHFGAATFMQGADFSGAKFTQRASFYRATFTQEANFSEATFTQDADFIEAKFTQRASFYGATFTQDAAFGVATFTQQASFSDARFTQRASFYRATFTEDAHFGARFTQQASFSDARFMQDAGFHWATFTQEALFGGTKFEKLASFEAATFLGPAEFRETVFREDGKSEPGPIFVSAQFSRPEAVIFYKTYLGQALFHDCDVSKFVFSSVRWRQRKGKGKRMVFEEIVDLWHGAASALKPGSDNPNERDYGLIAELYQQLKKNYDDRKDYWTAGDFHYGELEMKRLSSRHRNRVLRWLHRHVGLVAWYKYANAYGESYLRPALWLGAVLFLFTLLYPVAGLVYHADRADPATRANREQPVMLASTPAGAPVPRTAKLTYQRPSQDETRDRKQKWWARLRLVAHSSLTTGYIAAFQKDLVYEPSYPWGRVLALLEVVLTSTLFALFLLAVRRQFRR